MAVLAQRLPDHGKNRGNFHVEVVEYCFLVHSRIEKLQPQPENLEIFYD